MSEAERIHQKLNKYCLEHQIKITEENYHEVCKKALTQEEYNSLIIPENFWRELNSHAIKGDELFEKREFLAAIIVYKKGIALIPEPKNDYEAKLWYTAAIADAYWELKDFNNALTYLKESLEVTGGKESVFIRILCTEVYCELGDIEAAKKAFSIGCKINEKEMLENIDQKYLEMIKNIE